MHFTTVISLALSLAVAVTAAPTGDYQGLAARDASLASRSEQPDFYPHEISHYPSSELYAREPVLGAILETRAKYKASKISLTFNKQLQKGSIPQSEREDATELGKKAMFQASITAGAVIYGWHDENTEDPVEHFTIQPSAGEGDSKGKIHVHRDGSWTQGMKGAAASGNGQV
jgi:hypothetical protein